MLTLILCNSVAWPKPVQDPPPLFVFHSINSIFLPDIQLIVIFQHLCCPRPEPRSSHGLWPVLSLSGAPTAAYVVPIQQ